MTEASAAGAALRNAALGTKRVAFRVWLWRMPS